jgi:hypothetical protein
LADRVDTLQMTRREYVERAASPGQYVELFTETFGPVIALRRRLAAQPDRAVALERDLLSFATRSSRTAPDGSAEYHYEYLLVVTRAAR